MDINKKILEFQYNKLKIKTNFTSVVRPRKKCVKKIDCIALKNEIMLPQLRYLLSS